MIHYCWVQFNDNANKTQILDNPLGHHWAQDLQHWGHYGKFHRYPILRFTVWKFLSQCKNLIVVNQNVIVSTIPYKPGAIDMGIHFSFCHCGRFSSLQFHWLLVLCNYIKILLMLRNITVILVGYSDFYFHKFWWCHGYIPDAKAAERDVTQRHMYDMPFLG